MASALFSIKDTEVARKELSLLLQVDPSQLDNIAQAGQLTVDFQNLAEDMALQVLSRAVSNHGFTVAIGKRMASPGLVKSALVQALAETPAQTLLPKSETDENMARLARAVTNKPVAKKEQK